MPQVNEQMETSPLRKDSPINSSNTDALATPAEIERPRSALHSGDFREGLTQLQNRDLSNVHSDRPSNSHFEHLSSSPTTPWFSAPFHIPSRGQRIPPYGYDSHYSPGNRSRAPSMGSYSSSYVLKAPTSPLVHQANNTDLDFSPRTDLHNFSNSLDKTNRRRTLPPESFRGLGSLPSDSSASGAVNFSSPPRSSTSIYTLQLASSLQSSPSRARRSSLASDVSVKSHARMVGSYEESILRGRMSMNPSKPLDFTAQIGVLGKGKCKANLKCPPHVTVPFPAVFYSYPTSGSGRSIADDSPSPYVGLIDLENSLRKDESHNGPRHRRHRSPTDANNDPFADTYNSKPNSDFSQEMRIRKREKRNRRPDSPKRPTGGSYRIPQEGQLQIVIKNPHKTAVKLFLVPYDLSDMEPGTKTFIRQRSYSAGPTVDMPLSARKNLGTDRPEASLNITDDPKGKPVLRYLIHLNICCPSRGRFYLHSGIRVVFANRVPDGKEKLRNETQYPEPRYTPYKHARELNSSSNITKRDDRGYAHSSEVFSLSGGSISPGDNLEIPHFYGGALPVGAQGGMSATSSQMPSALPSAISERFHSTNAGIGRSRRDSLDLAPIASPRPLGMSDIQSSSNGMYNKLRKGDVGYGGHLFSSFSRGSDSGESLLAQRLKRLDVDKRSSSHTDEKKAD